MEKSDLYLQRQGKEGKEEKEQDRAVSISITSVIVINKKIWKLIGIGKRNGMGRGRMRVGGGG